MSTRIESKDIIWDGFEKGIADDPYSGIYDIAGMNIISIPGETSVSFSPTNGAPQPFIATISSFTGNIITANISTGTVTNCIAVQFTTTGTLPTGISTNTTYWINYQGSNTFKIYADCYLITQTTFTNGTGSGTYTITSIDMGQIRYFDRTLGYCIDTNGRVWSPISNDSTGITYSFMNNTLSSNTHGNGICSFIGKDGNKWLMVFRDNVIDYCQVRDTLGIFSSVGTSESGIAPSWQYSWQTLNTASGINNPHEAIIGPTNKMYWTDGIYVGSLREQPNKTFAPGDATTYEFNSTALATPTNDLLQCIDQLGNNILTGGLYNVVYSWDRISTGFQVIQIVEKGIKKILTVNTNAFIFAGNRGRIFVTNGGQAQLFKKIPDHLLGIDPVFTFYGVGYNKNQLYFGLSATTNGSGASTNYAGLWAIDIDSKALRRPTIQSTTNATVTAIFSLPTTTSGFSLLTAWKSGSTYGIDSTTSIPYTSYVSYAIMDMTPVGLYLNKRTLENIEFKLSSPLVSGESIKISYRTHISDTFTQIGETTTVGILSDVYPVNFENVQWLQLKVELKSTSSSPSYVRLKEIRAR